MSIQPSFYNTAGGNELMSLTHHSRIKSTVSSAFTIYYFLIPSFFINMCRPVIGPMDKKS